MVKLRLREVNYPAQAWNSDSNLGLFGYKAYARNRRYPFPPPLPHPLGLFNESSPWRTEVGGGVCFMALGLISSVHWPSRQRVSKSCLIYIGFPGRLVLRWWACRGLLIECCWAHPLWKEKDSGRIGTGWSGPGGVRDRGQLFSGSTSKES